MAKKMTPEDLRQQAQKIMNKAKKLETEENAKIGAYIRSVAESGFKIEYTELKNKISELLVGKNLSTINPK